jgi:hypothetical protein
VKHSIKVLALSVPLSFLLGLVLTYYQDKLNQNPNFLKQPIHILVSQDLHFDNAKAIVSDNSSYVIHLSQCADVGDCKQKFKSKSLDLAILPHFVVGELIQSDLTLAIKEQSSDLREKIHVDFRRPKIDPEGRFSLPLFWNALGFLCHSSLCSELENESLKSVDKNKRSAFVFLNTPQELSRLNERGLWENYQYHKERQLQAVLEAREKSLVQWPSGALRQKQIFELKDHSYRLPKFGASLFLYAAVVPSRSPDRADTSLAFLDLLMSPEIREKIHALVPAAFTFSPGEDAEKAIDPWQRSSQLRNLELYKLRFQDFALE